MWFDEDDDIMVAAALLDMEGRESGQEAIDEEEDRLQARRSRTFDDGRGRLEDQKNGQEKNK